MRSIPWIMTREVLSQGRWLIPVGAIGANALSWLVLGALQQEGGLGETDASTFIMHMTLLEISAFVFGVAVFGSQDPPARLYSYPISTRTLVLWRLLPMALLIAVQSALSTLLINRVFAVNWPILGPTLVMGVGVILIRGVAWLTERSTWSVIGIGLSASVLGIWFKTRYGPLTSPPDHFWTRVTLPEMGTLLLFSVAGFLLGEVGVARNRRGDPPLSTGLTARLDAWLQRPPGVPTPFAGPRQALFWADWRQKGWVLPAIVPICGGLGGVGWLLFSREPSVLLELVLAGGIVLQVAALVAGMLLGNLGTMDGSFDMSPCLATLPVTCAELAQSILWTLWKGVVSAWGLWIAALVLVWGGLSLAPGGSTPPTPTLLTDLGWRYIPASLVMAWILASVTVTCLLTGRIVLFIQWMLTGFALIFAATLLAKFGYALRPSTYRLVQQCASAGAGLFCLGLTTVLFVLARQRRLIAPGTVWTSAGLWGGLCLLTLATAGRDPWLHWPEMLRDCGLLALAVAPRGAVPLAISVNRTR